MTPALTGVHHGFVSIARKAILIFSFFIFFTGITFPCSSSLPSEKYGGGAGNTRELFWDDDLWQEQSNIKRAIDNIIRYLDIFKDLDIFHLSL